MPDSFFTTTDGEWFQPTDACRGPWDASACHAGPPAGLLARASERLVPDQRLVRLTVDLTRPIPYAGFRVTGEVVRAGRSVSSTVATIVDGDGRAVATARAMHITPEDVLGAPTASFATPSLRDARPDRFPVDGSVHRLPAFGAHVEARYPPGHDPTPGPTVMWLRTLPLLPDEEPSGFQRACPLADCGNAVSRNAEIEEFAFVNTDLTVVMHRDPVGIWIGTDSVSRWETDGIGLADSLLFDEHGACGRALQTLILRPGS